MFACDFLHLVTLARVTRFDMREVSVCERWMLLTEIIWVFTYFLATWNRSKIVSNDVTIRFVMYGDAAFTGDCMATSL